MHTHTPIHTYICVRITYNILCVYTYIYIYIYICACIHMYNSPRIPERRKVLLHEHRDASQLRCAAVPSGWSELFGKGQMGSALRGSLLILCFDRDLLGTPVNLFLSPQSARVYLFPLSVKNHYFSSGPISVDPICPQPNFLQARPVRAM